MLVEALFQGMVTSNGRAEATAPRERMMAKRMVGGLGVWCLEMDELRSVLRMW